jgi:uncharacterized membrane protein YphA (DoxX/SURF4 family)
VGWVVVITLRVILGTVLLVAGFAKLKSSPSSSFIAVDSQAGLVRVVLPVVEILLGTLILVGQWLSVVAPSGLLLFLAFVLYSLWRLTKGDLSPCNCFGQLSKSITGVQTIIRNSLLLALASVLAITTLFPDAVGVLATNGPTTAEDLAAVVILSSIGLVSLYLIELVDPRVLRVIWTSRGPAGPAPPSIQREVGS